MIVDRTRAAGEFRRTEPGDRRTAAGWSPLADSEGDRAGGDEGTQGAEHEDEADAAERRGTQPTEGRAQQEAAHLRCAVQPEGLATPFGRGRVRDVATGSRVVDRRGQALEAAEGDERTRPDERERQELEDPCPDVADDHERNPSGVIGEPPEDRLADEAGCRPRGDDDAQGPEIDAVLGEVEGHDRQQRAEAEPDDELGDEEREDRRPGRQPRSDAAGRAVRRCRGLEHRSGHRRRDGMETDATYHRAVQITAVTKSIITKPSFTGR